MQRYVKFGLGLVILTGIGICAVSLFLIKAKRNKIKNVTNAVQNITADDLLTSSSQSDESDTSDDLHLPSPPSDDLESNSFDTDSYYSAFSSEDADDEVRNVTLSESGTSTETVSDICTTISRDTTLTNPSQENTSRDDLTLKDDAVEFFSGASSPVTSSSETFYDSLTSPIVVTHEDKNNGSTGSHHFRYDLQRSPVVREYSAAQSQSSGSHFETNYHGIYDSYNDIVPPLQPNTGVVIFHFPVVQQDIEQTDSALPSAEQMDKENAPQGQEDCELPART